MYRRLKWGNIYKEFMCIYAAGLFKHYVITFQHSQTKVKIELDRNSYKIYKKLDDCILTACKVIDYFFWQALRPTTN